MSAAGKIKIVKNGELLPTPFADLPSEDTGDRGLIGIAFDPDFGVSNHYVYFYYTGHDLLNHLVRFSAADDVAADGPFELFRTSSPSQLLHVGGSIRFGPDGKLYFAVGDNGYGPNAQDLSSPHGKILRINKDGSIPLDNPFFGQPGKLGAIWAYGMRNPWRFQFDSATGRLYGGDVGDFSWEEVNRIVKGGNYGWPLTRGPVHRRAAPDTSTPLYAYPHAEESAAVTGGPVYRAGQFPPEYQGDLFFGDYAKGFIKTAELDANGDITAVDRLRRPGGQCRRPEGRAGRLALLPHLLPGRAVPRELQHAIPPACRRRVRRRDQGRRAAHGPLLQRREQRPRRGPAQPTSGHSATARPAVEANPTKTYAEKGVYTARLTVSAAGEQAQAQPIVIQVGLPPALTVSAPTEGQLYRAGDTITYNAFASDAGGFDLDDGDIKTEIRLHHGTHFHPFAGPLTGRAGSFTIPKTGEASADTSYEIKVTATDANGLFTSKAITIRPRKTEISLATSPPGLGIFVDGVPVATPRTFTGVEGFQRDLAAPVAAVDQGGNALQFAGWSDGKSVRHVINTPEDDSTYTASYVPAQPFTAAYYDNTTFSGAPVLTRQDPVHRLRVGRGRTRPCAAQQRLRGALEEDPVVRRRPLRVHRHRRRRRPSVHRRQAGHQQLAGTRQHGADPCRRSRRRPAHDPAGVLRVRRRRAREACLGQCRRPAVGDLSRAVLERAAGCQRDPRDISGARARRGRDRSRLGRGVPGAEHRDQPLRSPLDPHPEPRAR